MKNIVFLKRIHLFNEFSEQELESIAHIFQERDYRKGEIVFLAEETSKYMYIVKFGEVKVVQSSKDGRENILAIHHSGETFGELALLDGKTSPATVVAKSDCKIIFISKNDFHRVLLSNAKSFKSLLEIFCQKLREAWRTIQVLKYTDAETRLKAIILQLANSEGIETDEGISIKIKITHQDLAEMAGTSRETVSRLISRLQQRGVLSVVSHRITLIRDSYWEEP